MFKSKEKKDNPTLTSTVIGEGIRIEGTIISGSGSIRIDGNVISNMSVDGAIIIGETGFVKGDIKTSSALIAGRVEGNLLSDDGVHITSTGVLSGNITSRSLIIDEGATFTGQCDMTGDKKINLLYTKDLTDDKEDADPNLNFDKS